MNKILAVFALLCGSIMFGQTSISGTVIDSNTQEPLPGVNIKVAGKSIGVSTDFDGKFNLNVSDEVPFSVEITFVGYQKQILEITADDTELQIVLEENETSLDEVMTKAKASAENHHEKFATSNKHQATITMMTHAHNCA